MQTDVHDFITIIEDVLRSITVVDIPVEYCNFLSFISSILRGDRNVVKEAKAMDIAAVSVVTGWSYNAISSIILRFLSILIVKNFSYSCQAGLT